MFFFFLFILFLFLSEWPSVFHFLIFAELEAAEALTLHISSIHSHFFAQVVSWFGFAFFFLPDRWGGGSAIAPPHPRTLHLSGIACLKRRIARKNWMAAWKQRHLRKRSCSLIVHPGINWQASVKQGSHSSFAGSIWPREHGSCVTPQNLDSTASRAPRSRRSFAFVSQSSS